MPLYNDIVALLRGPVGNNLENHPDDLRAAKHLFAAEGRYKRPVDENKYLDQDLIDSMEGFQRDYNLKIDRRMNPGGETEAMLISKRLKLPQIEPSEEDRKAGYQQANAVPIFGALAMGLGMSAAGAAQWWANQSADDREDIVKSIERRLQGDTNTPDPRDDCMEQWEDDMDECKRVGGRLNGRARSACEKTATLILSQCQTGRPPKEDRRRLQTEF